MATSLAQRLGRVLDLRNRIPQQLGLRPNVLSIVRRTWPSGRIDDGDPIDEVIATISPTPKIEELTSEEIASSGGVYVIGDLRVSGITPAYPGPPAGGYTLDEIQPTVAAGTRGKEIVYVVTGPNAGEYRRADSTVANAFGWGLTLRQRTYSTA